MLRIIKYDRNDEIFRKTTMKKILIVDNYDGILISLEMFLRRANYDVSCTLCPNEALQMLKTDSYDILLSDINMPEMNGIELARRVSLFFADLKIVLMSSDNDLGEKLPYDFFPKQSGLDDLIKILENDNKKVQKHY